MYILADSNIATSNNNKTHFWGDTLSTYNSSKGPTNGRGFFFTGQPPPIKLANKRNERTKWVCRGRQRARRKSDSKIGLPLCVERFSRIFLSVVFHSNTRRTRPCGAHSHTQCAFSSPCVFFFFFFMMLPNLQTGKRKDGTFSQIIKPY